MKKKKTLKEYGYVYLHKTLKLTKTSKGLVITESEHNGLVTLSQNFFKASRLDFYIRHLSNKRLERLLVKDLQKTETHWRR